MCVSSVNGKSDRGNASEIQAVCKNRKKTIFSNALVFDNLV